MVRFFNAEEFRSTPSTMWKALDAGDDVAIVADGEPRAVVLRIDDGDVEAAMQLVRTTAVGLDRMSDEAINAEIAAARAERKARL